jgi:hypothetical protein
VGAAVDLLAREMSETFHDMRSRLHDLTEEFFWEPVPGSWTVFRDEGGRWDHHYEEPDPEPAPFTTIAWRLTHIAMCKVMYHEHALGPGELTWLTIETPGTSHDASRCWTRATRSSPTISPKLDDPDLERSVSTKLGR